MPDHELVFTGDPFLDGVIWARGVRKTLTSADIAVANMPYEFVNALQERAEALGFQTDYLEFHRKGGEDLRLIIAGDVERFRGLPMHRERRLVPGLPHSFLAGYMMACARVPKITSRDLDQPAPLRLHIWHEPVQDVLDALGDFGLAQASGVDGGRIELEPEDFQGMKELEAVRDMFLHEEREMRAKNGGTADALATEAALGAAQGASLAKLSVELAAKLSLARQLLADTQARSRNVETLAVKASHSRLHEGLVRDYCSLNDAQPDDMNTLTTKGMATLVARYEEIVAGHFERSKEFALALAMSMRLIDRIRDGAAEQTPLDQPADAFDPSGPTELALAEFLAGGPLALLFKTGRNGTRIVVATSKLPNESELRRLIGSYAADAIGKLRGLTFIESEELAADVLTTCTSCDQPLVLSSGQTCETCNVALCQKCFHLYSKVPTHPSPFAADPRVGLCATHAGATKKTNRGGVSIARIKALHSDSN